MDFKQLEAYVKIIELSSFSKAAEAIFLSQPSVSSYVSALERELSTILINRRGKEISPTLAGRIFYENAKEMLSLKHNTTQRITNLSGSLKGEITILASTVPSQYILPEKLSRFCEIHPDISFDVRQADTLEVANGIASQRADIGFSGGIVDNDKCEFIEVMSDQMVFIAPPDKGFSATEIYSLEDLLYNNRFISREKGSGTRAQYEKFFTQQGIDTGRLDSGINFDNTQSIIGAVINGLGISVVSECAARIFIEREIILTLNIKTKLPHRKFFCVLKKHFSRSHLCDLLIEFLCRSAIKKSDPHE